MVHIIPDIRVVCMENMRAVPMNLDSFHVLCINIARGMLPPVNHQHLFPAAFSCCAAAAPYNPAPTIR